MNLKASETFSEIDLFVELENNRQKEKEIYSSIFNKFVYIPKTLSAKYSKFQNYNDILQVGYLTLVKSISTFDYKKSSNFKGWSWWWVRKEIAKEAFREKRMLSEKVDLSEGILVSLHEESLESTTIKKDALKKIFEKIEELPFQKKIVLQKHYGLTSTYPLSLRYIASILDVSHETVRRIKISTIEELFFCTTTTNKCSLNHEC